MGYDTSGYIVYGIVIGDSDDADGYPPQLLKYYDEDEGLDVDELVARMYGWRSYDEDGYAPTWMKDNGHNQNPKIEVCYGWNYEYGPDIIGITLVSSYSGAKAFDVFDTYVHDNMSQALRKFMEYYELDESEFEPKLYLVHNFSY